MSRVRTLEQLLPIAAIEPDGLLVTTDGDYVRLLEATQVLQPYRGGPEHRARIRDQFHALLGRLPAGHALQVLVEAEPLDPDQALAGDWDQITAAADSARRRGEPELAAAMQRLGYGLEQTVRRSSPLLGANTLRWTVAVRYRPGAADLAGALRSTLPRLRQRKTLTVARTAHERAADESLRLAQLMASELQAADCQLTYLDATRALAALQRALYPGAPVNTDALADVAQLLQTGDAAHALKHRAEILAALSSTPDAALDFSPPDHLVHQPTGELEQIVHLSATPAETSPWWLMHLMETPPPWRLSVHITATDRAKARRSQRLRHKRLWAEMSHKEREGKLISPDAVEQEREAAELDAELRLTTSSGLFDFSCLLAIRRPAGAQDELAATIDGLAKQIEGLTDARLYGGRFLTEASFISSLPLGVDRLRATRRLASRNIVDCVPLLSASASSTAGAPLGYAQTGQTLERVDFFDTRYRTHVALVTGGSGSGKTVATNALLARNIARGARGFIIDRSSSEDEGGSRRQDGHYEQLADLIPGARKLHFGAGRHDAILNPWDTPDPADVPASKIDFLVAFHTLLIGDHGPGGARELAGLERTLLQRAIQAVYRHCARTGQPAREQVLHDELLRLAREQATDQADGDLTVASELRRLAARLQAHIGDGPTAWLADKPSTVDAGAPLVLFDLAGLPDALAGPVMLTLVDFIDREVQRRRARHLSDRTKHAGPWAGRAFVVIDEAWKPLMTPEAGAWLNEWARRTRHIACALLVVTQHLADFDNPQGLALLRNAVLRIFFRLSYEEQAGVAAKVGLPDEDVEDLTRLQTRKGEYSTCLIDSEVHGRAQVRSYLGDMEYWTCSADPDRDQPIRRLAQAQTNGDAWAALRLLVDPAWHREQAAQLAQLDHVDHQAAAVR